MRKSYEAKPSGREGSTESLKARYRELNDLNMADSDDSLSVRRERSDEMFQIHEELKARGMRRGPK